MATSGNARSAMPPKVFVLDPFFAKSRLQLTQLIRIMLGWSRELPQDEIILEAGISPVSGHTMVDCCNFCREICILWLENHPVQLGGFDNGESIVVEIDESLYFHRKYHRGAYRNGHWVFGGIERISKKCFLVDVPDRTAETLLPIIQRMILPGTTIMSDAWRSYGTLSRIGGGIYDHRVVVHQQHFVDPEDRDVHTENVENMWMRAKRKSTAVCYIRGIVWLLFG